MFFSTETPENIKKTTKVNNTHLGNVFFLTETPENVKKTTKVNKKDIRTRSMMLL